MFGNKLTAIVIKLTPGVEADTLALGDDRLEVVAYPSIEPWLPNQTSGSNGRSGTAPSPETDCLVLVGSASEVHRQQIVAQVNEAQAALPIVIVAQEPPLGETVGMMRQGAFAVVSSSDPADTITAVITNAASEGRTTAAKRKHLLTLRSRFTELTQPERQVLNAMLDGMANKQIAQALQIGLRTVELRRSKIMRKMGARSLAELVKFICLVMPAVTAEPPAAAEQPLSTVS